MKAGETSAAAVKVLSRADNHLRAGAMQRSRRNLNSSKEEFNISTQPRLVSRSLCAFACVVVCRMQTSHCTGLLALQLFSTKTSQRTSKCPKANCSFLWSSLHREPLTGCNSLTDFTLWIYQHILTHFVLLPRHIFLLIPRVPFFLPLRVKKRRQLDLHENVFPAVSLDHANGR